MDNKLQTYIKYLKYESEINALYSLDSFQIKILNELIYAEEKGVHLCVSDLMALKHIASPTTIHSGIKKLLAKELISFRTVSDTRIKYVELTKLGLERFKNLSKIAPKN
jgi:DNA-binding MarR family transcriptional regulator